MHARFVPPPGWPTPPPEWWPPPDWSPDPAWPAAPRGWQFWLPYPEQLADIDPYRTSDSLVPPVVVPMGTYRVDNAAAWAITFVPLVVWLSLVALPVAYVPSLREYLVSYALLVNVLGLPFYFLDRAALRQAGLDSRNWSWWIGPLWYLINRARYAGQTWAMPVLWLVGVLLALLI